MKNSYLVASILMLTLTFVGCKKKTSYSYFSPDLQMELLYGNVERLEVYEFIAKKKRVELKLKYYKNYDENGFLLPNSDFEEIRYLKQAALERGGGEIKFERNDKNEITTIRLDYDDGWDYWDNFEYNYDSIGNGYLISCDATYFEAGSNITFNYDNDNNLISETTTFYSHEDHSETIREFLDIKYDKNGNWIFRKVNEASVIEDEWTGRKKRSSKSYFELREIQYRTE